MAIRVLFPSSQPQPQPHLQPSRSSTTTRRSSRQRRGFCCFCSSTSSGGGDEVSSSSSMMTVSITGATGFIGRRLVDKLLSAEDHKVCVLTRSTSKNKASSVFPASRYPGVTIADKEGDWERCIRDSTGVVNLAGMPISTRWSPEVKSEILQSRVNVTSKVVDHINTSSNGNGPSVFVSATAVGYYGTSETDSFDESSPSGNDYLAHVCREWEGRARQVKQEHVRLVLIRIGVVLGKDGGALAKMIPLFMMFAGGPLGTGTQWFSWIHLDDLVDLIYESLRNPAYTGIINGTAPNPVRLSELCDRLGQVVGRPSWLPVPGLAIKALLGEGATVVLDGQKVLPAKATQLGFSYRYPYVRDALKAIAKQL
ncbi:epimerase family protein SDR39U1 homolog, chloroplastic isoform X1 [Triticum aestivum]|uniref:epimerase family protein SDR39U1 homolog, chloroplastic isoform X1 n=1 Tax=Triticum aestivum TaxID=4565 RepID=UPI001D003B40|nr:epimerase family protein SDR39U1 homolog, chloroplastic-like isoform X1 [Triticum aestivum]